MKIKNSLIFAISLTYLILIGTAVSAQYDYLPTGIENDGKMISVAAGKAYKTLSLEPTMIFISTNAVQLELGFFDAEIGGRWDSVDIEAGRIAYRLYTDPERTGDPQILVGEWFSDDVSAVDNGWYSITIPHHPGALNNGQYNYLLAISQLNPNAVSIADFKLRADGQLELLAGNTFGIEGAVTGAPDIIWPLYPDTSVTTYDGEWTLNLVVPDGKPIKELLLWDGDLDHGDNATAADTDDPDTPPIIPTFSLTDNAVLEGAQGEGSPMENNPNLGGIIARGNPVTYELVSPGGTHYINQNPSGNQEWEVFRIRKVSPGDTCTPSDADFCVTSIEPGIWQLNIHGLDLSNVVFLHFYYKEIPSKIPTLGNTWLAALSIALLAIGVHKCKQPR